MEAVNVRPTTKDDLNEIINMIQELADFEKMPHGPKLTREILLKDGGFNEENKEVRPFFHSFVAEIQNKTTSEKNIIGYTILYYCYSTWEGKSMFLEDLYVKPEYRAKYGAGTLLYKTAVQFALDSGCVRFDFHVLKWNPAKSFYIKMGATNLTEIEDWELFRMTQKEMEKTVKKF